MCLSVVVLADREKAAVYKEGLGGSSRWSETGSTMEF